LRHLLLLLLLCYLLLLLLSLFARCGMALEPSAAVGIQER
jgi:hypothetical protein